METIPLITSSFPKSVERAKGIYGQRSFNCYLNMAKTTCYENMRDCVNRRRKTLLPQISFTSGHNVAIGRPSSLLFLLAMAIVGFHDCSYFCSRLLSRLEARVPNDSSELENLNSKCGRKAFLDGNFGFAERTSAF